MQVFRVIYERLLSQGIILPSQVGTWPLISNLCQLYKRRQWRLRQQQLTWDMEKNPMRLYCLPACLLKHGYGAVP
jgi:hypothetical protein